MNSGTSQQQLPLKLCHGIHIHCVSKCFIIHYIRPHSCPGKLIGSVLEMGSSTYIKWKTCSSLAFESPINLRTKWTTNALFSNASRFSLIHHTYWVVYFVNAQSLWSRFLGNGVYVCPSRAALSVVVIFTRDWSTLRNGCALLRDADLTYRPQAYSILY